MLTLYVLYMTPVVNESHQALQVMSQGKKTGIKQNKFSIHLKLGHLYNGRSSGNPVETTDRQ